MTLGANKLTTVTVKDEILTAATARNGDRFAIVRCSDGSYGITRNRDLVHVCKCDADGLEECARMLIRFAVTGEFL